MAKAQAAEPWGDLIAAIPKRRTTSKLDRWISELPAKESAEFWPFFEAMTAKGHSVEALLVAWDAKRPPCPVSACTIRVRLRERRG